jgi:hypothetical protein
MATVALKKKMSKPKSTQLTDVMDFPADRKAMYDELKKRVVIDPPVAGTVPNSSPPISFHRLMIIIKNADGTEGDLVFALDRCFSFGTGENKSPDTQKLNGYSTSVSMYDREGATPRQLQSVQFIAVLSEVITDHLLQEEVKAAMDNYELQAHHLEKLNPLYYKKVKGKLVDGASPNFYPKLIWYGAGKDKNGKDRPANMRTKYYIEDEVDENGDQLEANPLDFIGVRHYITPAVKIESVFMGAKTKNLQCKVYEAEVKLADTGPKRLLKVAATRAPTVIINGSNPLLSRKNESKSDQNDEARASSVTITPTVTAATIPVVTAASAPVKETVVDADKLQASDEDEVSEEEVKPKKVKPKKVKVKKPE